MMQQSDRGLGNYLNKIYTCWMCMQNCKVNISGNGAAKSL